MESSFSCRAGGNFFRFLILSLAVFTGCQGGGQAPSDPPADPPADPSGTLLFEKAVPRERSVALGNAVGYLNDLPGALNASEEDKSIAELRAIMGISDFTAERLRVWLQERIRYIVNENYEPQEQDLQVTPYEYPFPDEVPYSKNQDGAPQLVSNAASGLLLGLLSLEASESKQESQVGMDNLGAAIYYAGKRLRKLVHLNLGGIGWIDFSSPRTGLLRIGPGIFPDTGNSKMPPHLLEILQLGVLFHEARHSDGHAESLSFFHTRCPLEHSYALQSACDAATNGPYSIGAQMMAILIKTCVGCDEKTKEALRLIQLDLADRVFPTYYSDKAKKIEKAKMPTSWDPAPEGSR